MLNRILNYIKKFIPKRLFKLLQPIYHWLLAQISAFVYGYSSNKMIVIGVTGTAGKSSTCYFIAQILEQAGLKVGMTTTTLFKDGKKEWLNDKKMTMIGRFQTQKLLRNMLRNKCKIAIIETTSQGIEQFRHIGINYDILVFTNLYPEHIEAHGNFEKYKAAKGKLFSYLSTQKHKNTKTQKHIKKTIIANLDDKHADYFLNFNSEQKIGFSNKNLPITNYQLPITKIIKNNNLKINLLGNYNVYNVLAAVSVAKVLNIDENKIKNSVANLKPLPGRLEFIENNLDIKIIVDYSFEPKAVQKLYNIIKDVPHKKTIHILGSTGGGRDKSRRPILGKLASGNVDIVIVTNEDPYDENPQEIIDQVAEFVPENKLYKILDRREAIKKAIELASKDDLILITGKGAEQAICVKNGKMIAWDDRKIVREEIKKIHDS